MTHPTCFLLKKYPYICIQVTESESYMRYLPVHPLTEDNGNRGTWVVYESSQICYLLIRRETDCLNKLKLMNKILKIDLIVLSVLTQSSVCWSHLGRGHPSET